MTRVHERLNIYRYFFENFIFFAIDKWRNDKPEKRILVDSYCRVNLFLVLIPS